MMRPEFRRMACRTIACAGMMLSWSWQAIAAASSYPAMAPVEQYMMPRDAEIALAKSAAPESISANAGVMVLGKAGFETAAESKNGFVCLVERSWTSPFDDPEFWNPKIRGPMCLNAAAVRSYLPQTILRTRLALQGRSNAEISAAVDAAFTKHELPELESGALCTMMSKNQYVHDDGKHWHPHLMFFVAKSEPNDWGAGFEGSPVLASSDKHVTIFMVPLRKWSDGSFDLPAQH